MPIDWTQLFKEYKGKWVALKDDEITVVGFGTSVTEALEEAKKMVTKNPFLPKCQPS